MSFLSSILKQNDLHEKTVQQKLWLEKQARETKEAESKLAAQTALTKQYDALQHQSLFPQASTMKHHKHSMGNKYNVNSTSDIKKGSSNVETADNNRDQKIIIDRSNDKALSWKQLMSMGNQLDPKDLSLKINKVSPNDKILGTAISKFKEKSTTQDNKPIDQRKKRSIISGRSRSNSPATSKAAGEKFIKLNVKKRDLRTLDDIQQELREKGKLSKINRRQEEAEKINKYREELQLRKQNGNVRPPRQQEKEEEQDHEMYRSDDSSDMETSTMDMLREERRS